MILKIYWSANLDTSDVDCGPLSGGDHGGNVCSQPTGEGISVGRRILVMSFCHLKFVSLVKDESPSFNPPASEDAAVAFLFAFARLRRSASESGPLACAFYALRQVP